jgi:glutamine amidotransferase
MIQILDYGLGNLRSVEKALELLGAQVCVSAQVQTCDKLIIPGVGAFGAAMEKIGPLAAEIKAFAKSGRPLLGICLGQQLLFETSEELGDHVGLGLIPGRVQYLPRIDKLKIPHIGWSPLNWRRADGLASGAIGGEQVYFVHSLHTACDDPADVAATATYGIEFVAAVQHGNVWGTQFHPEKSSEVGLRMLRAFVEC